MDKLPDELLLQVLSFLDKELIECQQLSSRFLRLCRDQSIWKQECFNASRAEARRRRQQTHDTSSQLSALRSAFSGLAAPFDQGHPPEDHSAGVQRQRALANWDPSYVNGSLNFYDEYIHRHAPINIGWLPIPGRASVEATGVGLVEDGDADPEHLVASLDDGSVCVWNMRPRSTDDHAAQGQVVGRSSTGLLSGGLRAGQSLADIRAIMTETGAVDSVSINSDLKRGYFAQNNTLVEVDLATLGLVSQEFFPFPITALSQTSRSSLVVGTSCTIHIHDPRNKSKSAVDPSLQCELIGGPSVSHATLSEPGPLSIVERFEDESIWVAGRFTHLLNYDRRFFPRVIGTVHSGGRISCISALPHPYVPRSLDLLKHPAVAMSDLNAAKSSPGATLLAAGEYKGKGSLEFYGLGSRTSQSLVTGSYQNRQTASSTRLLSVAAHGSSIVFSDGDGNLKWVERDGSTPIRNHNINGYIEPPSFNQLQSVAQNGEEAPQGDIVQKILPLHATSKARPSSRLDANQSDLVLKTGDGRVGILGFGHDSLYGREEAEAESETTEQREKRDAEKQYQETLRRALQTQADEVRFMRGLGMAFDKLR